MIATRGLGSPRRGNLAVIGFGKFASVLATTLLLPAIPSGSTLHAPAVAPGAVTAEVPNIDVTAGLYAPALVAGASSLQIAHIPSTAVLPSPVVTAGTVTVVAASIVAESSASGPTLVVQPVQVGLPEYAPIGAPYAPVVSVGAVTLEAQWVPAASMVSTPVIELGAVNVAPPLILGQLTTYSATLVCGPVTVDIAALPSSSTTHSPAVSRNLNAVAVGSTSAVSPPTVIYILRPPSIAGTRVTAPYVVTWAGGEIILQISAASVVELRAASSEATLSIRDQLSGHLSFSGLPFKALLANSPEFTLETGNSIVSVLAVTAGASITAIAAPSGSIALAIQR